MAAVDSEYLFRLFSGEGITLSDTQLKMLELYADLLVEWNEKINLTAITDPCGIAEKHFLDSCLPIKLAEIPENAKIIDVGTGAGFPGIPLKILREDLQLTLLDSLNKRLSFLAQVTAAINVTADMIHGRAEDLGAAPQMREGFDIATARAVARLPVLCEYCLPFVRVGGCFLALKGADSREEADSARAAVKLLGGEISDIIEYKLPSGDSRSLFVIKKVKPTPKEYPRPKGRMNKKPL